MFSVRISYFQIDGAARQTFVRLRLFSLLDAKIVSDGKRKVFKFHLKPVDKKPLGRMVELPVTRLIPTHVKVAVWKRDGGVCVLCGSATNLHYDHDIPFSKGGSSMTEENVKLLCAKHNLSKSDKIMVLIPAFIPLTDHFFMGRG